MDEDVEFRDMVLKKLEENGSLLEIKAKLRAYLYDVIENDGKVTEAVHDADLTYNSADKSELEIDSQDPAEAEQLDDRSLALGLVFDLLDCLKLPYTKKVLSAETGLRRPCSRGRLKQEFLKKSSNDDDNSEGEAILLQIIQQKREGVQSEESSGDISQVSKDVTENRTAPDEELTDNSVATTI